MLIYKILLPSEWEEFQARGEFEGSAHDRRDGFIHLSARDQVAETAGRVFAAEPELVVAAVDTDAVAAWLRWEESASRGAAFPHVYAALPLSAVVEVYRVGGSAEVDAVLPPAE
ncbi:DUF952 domain-containing protein [Catellatospora sp. NPDC049609]|uniref:DUF952 domain-containing protein n=1 Tax=Catellatospora sp. NPDC049609 TaxID=3155505 RepID=UPI00342DC044